MAAFSAKYRRDQVLMVGKAPSVLVRRCEVTVAAAQLFLDAQEFLQERLTVVLGHVEQEVFDARPRTLFPGVLKPLGRGVNLVPSRRGNVSHGRLREVEGANTSAGKLAAGPAKTASASARNSASSFACVSASPS